MTKTINTIKSSISRKYQIGGKIVSKALSKLLTDGLSVLKKMSTKQKQEALYELLNKPKLTSKEKALKEGLVKDLTGGKPIKLVPYDPAPEADATQAGFTNKPWNISEKGFRLFSDQPYNPWGQDYRDTGSELIFMDKKGGKVKSCQEGGDTSTWDKVKYLIPGVGTYYDIQEAYNNPTFRNVATAALSTAGDVFGAGLIGRSGVQGAKWLLKTNKLKKLGYVPIDNAGTWLKFAKTGKVKTPAGYFTNNTQVVTQKVLKPDTYPLWWSVSAGPARVGNEIVVADRSQ